MKFITRITSALTAFSLASCGTYTYEDTRPRDQHGDLIYNLQYDRRGKLESYQKIDTDGRPVTYLEYKGEFKRVGETQLAMLQDLGPVLGFLPFGRALGAARVAGAARAGSAVVAGRGAATVADDAYRARAAAAAYEAEQAAIRAAQAVPYP